MKQRKITVGIVFLLIPIILAIVYKTISINKGVE